MQFSISYYNFYIKRDKSDNIIYPYKIKKGVSNQFIALELLKLNNFDEDIIDLAINESTTMQEKDRIKSNTKKRKKVYSENK